MFPHSTRLRFRVWLSLILALVLQGCATINPPDNVAITQIDEQSGYRMGSSQTGGMFGDTLVLLSFSGGGTRAAALSYGVLQELRDTIGTKNGETSRLLDEVDLISSVSGGSFTSAYYGLYRDKIFEDFEKDFLRLGVQQALINQLFNPMHWLRSTFYGFDRTEMAIDYYNRMIFKGATFADLNQNGKPFIDINATDLTTGQRFTFTPELFDLICTDLNKFSIARAVTASSAVPVAFPTVVLKNHAGKCDVSATAGWAAMLQIKARVDSEAQKQVIDSMISLRDAQQRPYIHLVDGGISDNLGLRAIIDRFERSGNTDFGRAALKEYMPKNILVLLVNAEVKRDLLIEKTARKPSVGATMSAYTSAQMNRYNQETLDRLQAKLDEIEALGVEIGKPTNVYFSEVSFDLVKQRETYRLLNSLPTSLELEDNQVDVLINGGRLLLRREPQFIKFKQDNQLTLIEDAPSDQALCELAGAEHCATLSTAATAP
jgi:NTE family protein